ncbi:MAG TPA: hypothetical protein VE733_09090 [Streptosporangiaceae bacterium]|nr:hypothetical protein [Streptosporangiaceae bacterium]
MGVDETAAALRFGGRQKAKGTRPGRFLWLGSDAAFELTFWCGTCPVLFQRLEGATSTLSIAELEDRLRRGLSGIDCDVLAAFAGLLPAAAYMPMLLGVTPRLVTPVAEDDYFAHEQVTTWGLDDFWGLPENPRTPYYRTFETPVTASAHLYEFVVPMVPPTWNDRARVQQYAQALETSSLPTAVAVSTLDISQPALDDQSSDYYEHWALIHFLLDGHHKLEAAAATGRSLQLLTLVAIDASLAKEADVLRLPAIRAQAVRQRP